MNNKQLLLLQTSCYLMEVILFSKNGRFGNWILAKVFTSHSTQIGHFGAMLILANLLTSTEKTKTKPGETTTEINLG